MSEREKMLTDKMDVDEEGFLLEHEKWTREIAEILAQAAIQFWKNLLSGHLLSPNDAYSSEATQSSVEPFDAHWRGEE